MELKDYIKNVLAEIFKGVEEAQKELEKSTGIVNALETTKASFDNTGGKLHNRMQRDIDFEIMITTSEDKTNKGSISVLGGALNLGVGTDKSQGLISANKIKFSIPVVLPYNGNK